jgi:hypothetical protein
MSSGEEDDEEEDVEEHEVLSWLWKFSKLAVILAFELVVVVVVVVASAFSIDLGDMFAELLLK